MNCLLMCIAVPLFFLLDLLIYSLAGSPFFVFSRALFYALVISKTSVRYLTIPGLFVLLGSFLVSGVAGADLVVMIPLSFFLRYASRVAHIPAALKIFAVFICLLVHGLLIDVAWMGLSVKVLRIVMDFLTAYFMIYLVSGSQGNRS